MLNLTLTVKSSWNSHLLVCYSTADCYWRSDCRSAVLCGISLSSVCTYEKGIWAYLFSWSVNLPEVWHLTDDASEWDMEMWWPEVENVTRGRSLSVTFSTEGRPIFMFQEQLCVICFVVWPTTRILNYKWLTVANVNEYRLPCKNAHSPNYCSWLAVCVNDSANFYCKVALNNRFELYNKNLQ